MSNESGQESNGQGGSKPRSGAYELCTLPLPTLAPFAVESTLPSHGSALVNECWPTSTTCICTLLLHVDDAPPDGLPNSVVTTLSTDAV